jgi:hypothetical protein
VVTFGVRMCYIVMVRMDDTERAMLERLTARWDVCLSADRRLIRESDGTPKRD